MGEDCLKLSNLCLYPFVLLNNKIQTNCMFKVLRHNILILSQSVSVVEKQQMSMQYLV